jgi:hypothetical protein
VKEPLLVGSGLSKIIFPHHSFEILKRSTGTMEHHSHNFLTRWMYPVLLVVTSLLTLAGPVVAQVAVVEVDPTPKTQPFDVDLGYAYQGNTDLDKSGGDFHLNSFRIGFNAEIAFNEKFKVDNLIVYENHNYTFSRNSPFQWEDIHRVIYAPLFKYQASDHWTILGAPVLQWFGEGGAKAGDSFNGGALLGFNYRSSPDLSLGLLVGALSQIEDDAVLVPLPLVHWKFAEKWMLRVGPNKLGATVGLGGEVGFKLNKFVELAGGLQYQRRRFRLDKRDQVGEETQVPFYGKFTWWMIPQGSVEFFASLVTNGNLRLENKNGNKITDKDYDNTSSFGARLHFMF